MATTLKQQLIGALREIQLELIPAQRETDGPIPQRPLVRKDEAARLLGVSTDTIERYLDTGMLEGTPGGVGMIREHRRVTTASIRRFVGGTPWKLPL